MANDFYYIYCLFASLNRRRRYFTGVHRKRSRKEYLIFFFLVKFHFVAAAALNILSIDSFQCHRFSITENSAVHKIAFCNTGKFSRW